MYDTRKAVIFRWDEKRNNKISEGDLELTKKKGEVLVDRSETVIIIEGRKSAKESPISLNALTEIFRDNLEAEKNKFSFKKPGLKEKVFNGGKSWYKKEKFADKGVKGGINFVTLNAVVNTFVEDLPILNRKSGAEIILDRAVAGVNNPEVGIDVYPIRARELPKGKSVYVTPTAEGYKISKGYYYKASEKDPGVATQR